jgi:chromosome segregation ATPase
MRKGQRDYDAVFDRLNATEAHYFDLLNDIDHFRADSQAEEEAQIHEINVLHGELENINARNEDKAIHADRLNGDLSHLRADLNNAEEEIRELSHEIRGEFLIIILKKISKFEIFKFVFLPKRISVLLPISPRR